MLLQTPSSGFVLISVLLVSVLMSVLVLHLHLQVIHHWTVSNYLDSQMYSLLLAESGVEYARTILPHLDLNSVLLGLDGAHAGTRPGWRNPATFAEARLLDPMQWSSLVDDGLPHVNGQMLLPQGYGAAGSGRFFIRFSNNPEEAPDLDQDSIVLVRSLGIVSTRSHFLLNRSRNSFAIVEARLRQEKAFLIPSPLTLFGDAGAFEWNGNLFVLDGGNQPAVSVVVFSEQGLQSDLLDSVSEQQKELFRGKGGNPSLEDASLHYQQNGFGGIFKPEFWRHFESRLPDFADNPPSGIVYFPSGGDFSGEFQGVLVAKGNLTLLPDASIKGLLLHLGGGKLLIQSAQIRGGVWMSDLDCSTDPSSSRQLKLRMEGAARLNYDSALIKKALAYFPPTQIGWRILFPEMEQ